MVLISSNHQRRMEGGPGRNNKNGMCLLFFFFSRFCLFCFFPPLQDNLGGLSLATALWSHIPTTTTATGSETSSTRLLLESTTPALAGGAVVYTTTVATSAGSKAGASSVCGGSWTALLDGDLLTSNLVGVGCHSSVVASDIREFNKGTVLLGVSFCSQKRIDRVYGRHIPFVY